MNFKNKYNIFDKNEEKISLITIQNHKKNLILIKEKCNLDLEDFEKRKPEEILSILKTKFNKNSGYYKNVLSSISKYLNLKKIPRDIYLTEMKKLSVEYLIKRETNEKNEKEIKNWIEFEELEKFCLKLLNKNINLNSMIIASYVLIPPIRNDWCSVKLNNYEKNTDNFLEKMNENNFKLVLNNYKTSKIHGKIEYILPNNYKKYLEIFINKQQDNENQEYLFVSKSKEKFTKNNFSKKIVRIFKKEYPEKNINIQMLRKIFSSKREKESLKNIREISKVMGHGLIEHMRYFKINKTNNKFEEDIEQIIEILNKNLPKNNLLNYITFNSNLKKWVVSQS